MSTAKNILLNDAKAIYEYAIGECMPKRSVENALASFEMPKGKLILVSIGKAGWEMANSAHEILGDKIDSGIVITKYEHSKGKIGKLEIYEASHPVVDKAGIDATKRALEMTENLSKDDTVLFLISGGGSALFEDVSCSLEKMQSLTHALLKSGASINEMNAIRKHISNVKGGKFANHIYPASVYAVALSDVIGDDLSTIASGPACPDTTTVEWCLEILERYNIKLDDDMLALIKRETPKEIKNAHHIISGSVRELCGYAMEKAEELGYNAVVKDSEVQSDCTDMANLFTMLANTDKNAKAPIAYIYGGEITLQVKGNGKGGRNQELALRVAKEIEGFSNVAIFCVGSDGTDGPTDAAGGYADGYSWRAIYENGGDSVALLENNDSYNALRLCDGLIHTGPTGTNVNDMYILLIKPQA